MSIIIRFLKSIYWTLYNVIPIHGENNTVIGYCRNKKIVGNYNTISIGNKCLLDCSITIYGNRNVVRIEDGVVFKSGTIWIEDDNNTITIGRKTTIENAELATAEGTSIFIGKDCMISKGVRISTSDAHSIIKSYSQERINQAKDIHIGNHVWIGIRSIVCKGVIIEHDSIVGAQSVVTHKVEPYTVVAGNPAITLKGEVTWLRERIK